jgi:PKD repeat protein
MLSIGGPGALAAPDTQSPLRYYVVGFGTTPSGLAAGASFHGARVDRVDRTLDFARIGTRSPVEFLAAMKEDARVRYVEPDPSIKLISYTPNDSSFQFQYGPQQIRAPEAWDTTLGDLDAAVCVVDTGVRYTHEEIAGPRWLGGHDYINNDMDPNDDHGHGTHVAGIAAGTIDNGKGIAGTANVGVYGVKVLDSNGNGPWSAVASGIRWCADNGMPRTVISMSLGAPFGAQVLQDAVQYANQRGNLLVAAAGNGGPCTNCVQYPGKYPEVMAVTCTTSSTSQCGFSSDGPESEIAGPGNLILSSWNTSDTAYHTISGTSMSTPHVSGAAALLWSHYTGFGNGQLRQRLRDTAQDVGTAGWDEQFGYGIVDANAAIDAGPPPPQTDLLSEDFDDGVANGWTRNGLWHVSSACASAPSAPNYLAFNQDADCEYSTGARVQGNASFNLDLTGQTEATLRFDHRFEKEVDPSVRRDEMKIEVALAGSTTWSTLRLWDSRNTNQPNWTSHSVDLNTYAGSNIMLRFRFDTRDHLANNYAGWFIDNVAVTVPPPPGNQAPIALAGADQTIHDDDGSGSESVTLDGTGSSDDGTIVSYEWTEAGLPVASGPTPVVDLGVGMHALTLTVEDNEGETDTDDVIVTVEANQPPTASFTHIVAGLTLDADGSGSSDDGSITNYEWDWGDGQSTSGPDPTVSHTYAAAGTYTVSLTVTDNGGETGSTSKEISVSDAVTLFSEDFDDGSANGWALGGLWHVSSQCASAPSAPNYLGFNQDSDCEYSTDKRVQGNAQFNLDLTGQTGATLTFDHRFEKETDPSVRRDEMKIEVAIAGSTTWSTLKLWDSRDANQPSWAPYSVDLDTYAGDNIMLRFRFDTRDHLANNYAGWFIDNVVVIGE